jgi:outer membrane beta-barrel protein
MKKNILLISTVYIGLMAAPLLAKAQQSDDVEVVNLEGMYQNSNATKPVPVAVQSDAAPIEEKKEDVRVNELKDLSRLSPFREVSVIQKKYLPKTERFQFFGALATTTNTPWFLNYGAKLGLAYHFTESFGLELSGLFLSSSEREVAKEIRDNNGLRPEQFIYTKGYYGLDLMWSPIYGKLSNMDGGIIPFDMYFSIGGGSSNTNSAEGNVPTVHVGTGQIFAITKSIAFRWDYSLNIFQATPVSVGGSSTPAQGGYNDLILTAGVSFFFPEASLR